MRSTREHKYSTEEGLSRELTLLSGVEAAPEASQRHLARQLGVSLGLTNLLLRRVVQKGYVRVTRAGWRRWVYALTPVGFVRKVHLMAAYINGFLDRYRNVRRALQSELQQLDLNSESRIAIYGTGELGELVYLGLRELGIEEVDVFASDGSNGSRFLGMPVRDLVTLNPEDYDRVVIAELNDAKSCYAMLHAQGVVPRKLVTLFGNGPMLDNVELGSEGM